MYIVDVITLIQLPPSAPQVVSYFHVSALKKGALVEVPYHRRSIPAIVVSSIDIEKEKTLVKKSAFQLQKIRRVLDPNPRAFDYQFEDTRYLSDRYASALGMTLKNILPPFAVGKRLKEKVETPNIRKGANKLAINYIKGSVEKRFSYIADQIRKRKGQVLILFPDTVIARDFMNSIKDRHPLFISSQSKKKEWVKAWNEAATNKKLVLVGSRQSIFLPFFNMEKIIIEDPTHEFYKSEMSPKYETLDVVKKKALDLECQLIMTGAIPSIEIWNDIEKKKYMLIDLGIPETKTEVISSADEITHNNFSPLSKRSQVQILESLDRNKKVLIFSSRKGFASMLACKNCGQVVQCPNCSAGMRVYKSESLDLMCHHCGHKSPKPTNCPKCHDYNFRPVGAGGSQKLYEEVNKLLESNNVKVPVLIIDSQVTQNEAEEEELLETIKQKGGCVVIATDMIFSHKLTLNFETIIIPYADSMWSFPDFRSDDRLIYIAENLKSLEPKHLLIQTFIPESDLMNSIVQGKYDEYISKSLKEREALSYPPFSRLVKLSFSHRDAREAQRQARVASDKMRRAISYLNLEDKIRIYDATPAFIHKVANVYRYNMVFKVLDPDLNLNEFLSFAPPKWISDVDPRQIYD